MKKTLAATAALMLALGGVALTATAAQAHTPSISASCEGVTLTATSYDGKKENRWHVVVGDKAESGIFGADFTRTLPVPQDGAVTSWKATIAAHDGGYRQEKSGTVGPCGTVPVIAPQIQDYMDCTGGAFVLDNTGSNRDVVYTVNGTTYTVAAGTVVHTPRVQAASYTITAADKSWTFAGLAPQSVDPEAPCFDRPEVPPVPETKRTVTEWVGEYDCGDTKVLETRTWTEESYGWAWNEATKSYDPAAASSTGTEERVRDLEQHELDDLAEACYPVTPPTTPEGPAVPPVTPDAPNAPAKAVTPATPTLATTGNEGVLVWALGAGLALMGGLVLTATRLVRR